MRISFRDIIIFLALPIVCLTVIPLTYSTVIQNKIVSSANDSLNRLYNDHDALILVYFKQNNQVILEKQKTSKPKVQQNYSTWLKTNTQKISTNLPASKTTKAVVIKPTVSKTNTIAKPAMVRSQHSWWKSISDGIFGGPVWFVQFKMLSAIAYYICYSLLLRRLAKKFKTKKYHLVWIPIVQELLVIKMAKKNPTYFWWYVIPVVNFVAIVHLWKRIAGFRKRPELFSYLMIIPGLNILALWKFSR
jgi:hypothetical protein